MRQRRLTRIVAGAVAGCPGIDDQAPPQGSQSPPPSTAAPGPEAECAQPGPRRSAWVTGAAVLLVVQGALGIVYAPGLAGGGSVQVTPAVMLVWAFAAANVAAGLGLLRFHAWARIAAGAIAAVSLLLMEVPALVAAAERGAWPSVDGLGLALATHLVVLFAVVRRWPRGSAG
jgi:hypothetical protein